MTGVSPTQNKTGQMLDLLDRAYEVPENPEQFDALLESAQIYFFDETDPKKVSPDLPRYAGLDPHIEKHVARLEGLVGQSTTRPKLGLSLSHHAQMTVAETGAVLSLNDCAQDLFGIERAAFLEGLPITRESLTDLRRIVKEVRAGIDRIERIIRLQTDTVPQKSVFAFCRAVSVEDENLSTTRIIHISLSEFTWSEALLQHLETALGLTPSEGLVLQGVLSGQSHKVIADNRGRSVDTIKAQAKSVLQKSGCAKMTDLAHLCTSIAYVIGLSELAHPDKEPEEWVTPKQNMKLLPLKDGRQLAYYEYGDPKGKPVLFIHGLVYGPYFMDSMLTGFLDAGIRLIAPSRPGFGHTDPDQKNFNKTVIDDTLALVEHLRLSGKILLIAHQGGGSHAFRIGKRLEPHITKLMLIGAGIPITPKHIRRMDPQTRIAAVASRHAPSVMKMIATMAYKSYRKRGLREYLERYFAASPNDLATLSDPEIYNKLCEGYYHLLEQSLNPFIKDGAAAMGDWTADFEALSTPQHWIHGANCPVMNAEYLTQYIQDKTNYPVDLLPDTGINILYHRPHVLLEHIVEAVKQA